jgi:hypothetical protein
VYFFVSLKNNPEASCGQNHPESEKVFSRLAQTRHDCTAVSPTSKEVEKTAVHAHNETPISPTTFAWRRSNKKRFEFDLTDFKREINQDKRRSYWYSFMEWSFNISGCEI